MSYCCHSLGCVRTLGGRVPYFFTSNWVVNVFCFQWSNFAITVHVPSLSSRSSLITVIISSGSQNSAAFSNQLYPGPSRGCSTLQRPFLLHDLREHKSVSVYAIDCSASGDLLHHNAIGTLQQVGTSQWRQAGEYAPPPPHVCSP